MANRVWWVALVLTGLGLLCVLFPYALSAHYLEMGAARLAASESAAALKAAPAGALQAVANDLSSALRWDGRNVQARRQLARTYLALEAPQMALEALRPARAVPPVNSLVNLELATIYAVLDQPGAAVQEYEESSVLGAPNTGAAVSYLQLAEARVASGDLPGATALWTGLATADPGNLYALCQLAALMRQIGGAEQAASYEERLRYFNLQAVAVPTDARLAERQGLAIATLVKDGLWERETLLAVLSHLAYQSSLNEFGPMAKLVLRALVEQRPQDPDGHFYLAELYARLSETEKAEEGYQRVLALDPVYTVAYLRLGMLYQHQGGREDLERAAQSYRAYYQLEPTDPLGPKKLDGVCRLMTCDNDAWRSAVEAMLAQRTPQFSSVSKPVQGWQLVGYDADEDRLLRGEPTALWLYWRQPDARPPEMILPENSYWAGGYLVQVVEEAVNRHLGLSWQGVDAMRGTGAEGPLASTVSAAAGTVINMRVEQGAFAVRHTKDSVVGALRLSPVDVSPAGGDVNLDAFFEGGVGGWPAAARQTLLLTFEARLSTSAAAATAYVQHLDEGWDATWLRIDSRNWQHYAIGHVVPPQSVAAKLGIGWEPEDKADWLEIRNLVIVAVPYPVGGDMS